MGQAGIFELFYDCMIITGSPNILWRTLVGNIGRGGTRIDRFDYDVARKAPLTNFGEISEEILWNNLSYFLNAIIPVAEEAGVKMLMHPHDPQVPSLAGIPRLIRSVEAYDRVFKIMPSKANGMVFCLGCFSQMLDNERLYEAIRHFGKEGCIGRVHFRGVRGTREKFDEVFADEGKLDMLQAFKLLKEVGFNGYVESEHAPHTTTDSEFGHIGRAFQIGYLKGILQGADALS